MVCRSSPNGRRNDNDIIMMTNSFKVLSSCVLVSERVQIISNSVQYPDNKNNSYDDRMITMIMIMIIIMIIKIIIMIMIMMY